MICIKNLNTLVGAQGIKFGTALDSDLAPSLGPFFPLHILLSDEMRCEFSIKFHYA